MSDARPGRTKDGLNQDCPPEHGLSITQLDFLRGGSSLLKKASVPNEQGRSMAFGGLALEVTWGHFCPLSWST